MCWIRLGSATTVSLRTPTSSSTCDLWKSLDPSSYKGLPHLGLPTTASPPPSSLHPSLSPPSPHPPQHQLHYFPHHDCHISTFCPVFTFKAYSRVLARMAAGSAAPAVSGSGAALLLLQTAVCILCHRTPRRTPHQAPAAYQQSPPSHMSSA